MALDLLPSRPTVLLKFKKDQGLYKQYIELLSIGKKKKSTEKRFFFKENDPFVKIIPATLNSLPQVL